MELSIVILNYKQKGLVKYCLKNLLLLNLPFKHEIIVVDNNSGDNIGQMIGDEFMSVRFIKAEKNKGYAAGNNLGIKAANGKYILILNPDVTILTDAIVKLRQFLEARPEAGMAGPKVLNPDGSLQATCLRFPDWRLPFYRRTFLGQTSKGLEWNKKYLMEDFNHMSDLKVDWLFGACLMVKKEALAQTGLLDERYFLYMEDLDWCRSFWQNNWEVWYVPEAKVTHFHQRISADAPIFAALFSKTARTHLTSWLKYYLKFRSKKQPRI